MDVVQHIKAVVDSHPVVLFMRGTPNHPMCAASQRLATLLTESQAPFHVINLLEQPVIRAGLPRFSNSPAFPQFYIHGELIGGAEIADELEAAGQLQPMLRDAAGVAVS